MTKGEGFVEETKASRSGEDYQSFDKASRGVRVVEGGSGLWAVGGVGSGPGSLPCPTNGQ